MKTTAKPVRTHSAAAQLAGFIAKFDPSVAALIRSCRGVLRKRFAKAGTGLRQLQLFSHRLFRNRATFRLHCLLGRECEGSGTVILLRSFAARS